MRLLISLVFASLLTISVGCKKNATDDSEEIKIDGSSTVNPISVAMAKNFKTKFPKAKISVGISGSGGGFKKFSQGETDISNASRKIKSSEVEKCKKNNIEFVELRIGLDGLAVIINKENDWATKMTVAQLKKIWHPDNDDFKNAKKWSDVNPKWPEEKISLWGPGIDSGTFDYFTAEINGKEKRTRNDYSASEDDNQILNGVIKNKYALGYLGLAYYEGHREDLTAVAIAEDAKGPFVLPTAKNVLENSYRPLSRPLFIYAKKSSLKKSKAVREFVKFHLRRSDLVAEAKYVSLSDIEQNKEQQKLDKALKDLGVK